MSAGRQLLLWLLAALAALALLLGVLRWESRQARARWNTILVGDPQTGRQVFDTKGCVRCHAVNGAGGTLGPDLGTTRVPRSGPDRLVTAMWNHAPRMWERMQVEHVSNPRLGREEMAHVFAYLYAAQYAGEPGDARRGAGVFESKGCARCHALRGGGAGTDLSGRAAARSPVAWTRAMWNHARSMEAAMREASASWPRFEDGEMNDLLTFVGGGRAAHRPDAQLLGADPDRGWQLFQTKSCVACHSLRGETDRTGPGLGRGRDLPPTIVQLAGSMWNHSPRMWRAGDSRQVERPRLDERETADLIAFLYSFRYVEPGGSPKAGAVLFSGRGCGSCHGPRAEGGALGPALRGRGRSYNSVTLAAALWSNGPRMYERAREKRLPWPTLAEGDVGDLLTFLNTSPEGN